MKKFLLSIIFFLCAVQLFYSQEDGAVSYVIPQGNSLKFNSFVINPTFSFVRQQTDYITLFNKRQWMGFDNAPLTYSLSYSGRFKENEGIAVGVFQQNYGVLTTFGVLGNFAHNIMLEEDSNLTFGINLSAYKSGLNRAKVVTSFADATLDNIPSNNLMAISPGINYGTTFLDFGVAYNNLVTYNFSSGVLKDDPNRGFQAHVMYTGFLDSFGSFDKSKFSALVKTELYKEKTIISGTAVFTIPKGIWAQVGYNTVLGGTGGLGFNITQNIALEYSYGLGIGDVSNLGGSHIIVLAYKLKNNRYDYDEEEEGSIIPAADTRRSAITKTVMAKPKADTKATADANAKAAQASKERLAAASKARADAAEARAKVAADSKAKSEATIAAAKAKLAADQKAKADAVTGVTTVKKEPVTPNAKLIADAKAKADADASAKTIADAKAKALAADNKAKADAAAAAKLIEDAKVKAVANAQAKLEADNKAKADATASEQAIAEAKAKLAADNKAKADAIASEKAKVEAETKAKLAADNKAKADAVASEKVIAENKAKVEAEIKAKLAADNKTKADAVASEKAIADAKEKLVADNKAKADALVAEKLAADNKVKAEAAAQAKLAADNKAKADALVAEKLAADNKAKADAAAQAKLAADNKAKADALAAEKLAADNKAKADAAAQAKLAADNKAKADALIAEKLAADNKAKADALVAEKLAADNKVKADALIAEKLAADNKAKADAAAQAKLAADNKAKADADAQAKLVADAKAKADAAAQIEQDKIDAAAAAKLAVEALAKAKADAMPKDEYGKSMDILTKSLEDSKRRQQQLLNRLDVSVTNKQKALKELKDENDQSDQGIVKTTVEFKSTAGENNELESIRTQIDEVTRSRAASLAEFNRLYNERLKKAPKNDLINQNYLRTIESLKAEQAQAEQSNAALISTLEKIKLETEIEKKRRIKRAASLNDQDRSAQDLATLNRLKQTTKVSATPLTPEDFDFGDTQSSMQIIKNNKNVETGYYMILSVQNDAQKRDAFVTKTLSAGQKNVNFFYDANTSKYFIYTDKFEYLDEATSALSEKGTKPYNGKMTIVKIEK